MIKINQEYWLPLVRITDFVFMTLLVVSRVGAGGKNYLFYNSVIKRKRGELTGGI